MKRPLLLAALLALTSPLKAQTEDDTNDGWLLMTMDGQEVSARFTLNTEEPGRFSGQGPCNNWSGK